MLVPPFGTQSARGLLRTVPDDLSRPASQDVCNDNLAGTGDAPTGMSKGSQEQTGRPAPTGINRELRRGPEGACDRAPPEATASSARPEDVESQQRLG